MTDNETIKKLKQQAVDEGLFEGADLIDELYSRALEAEWRPIETAPKDYHGDVLIFDYVWGVMMAHMDDGKFYEGGQETRPLYWQPLPAPPDNRKKHTAETIGTGQTRGESLGYQTSTEQDVAGAIKRLLSWNACAFEKDMAEQFTQDELTALWVDIKQAASLLEVQEKENSELKKTVSGSIRALETLGAKLTAAQDEITNLKEQVHYANGVAELAMKHRDEAEAEVESLKESVG